MSLLLLTLGLLVFLGSHSIRIVADPWRNAQIQKLGDKTWKGLFTVVSIVSFVLIVWAYGQSRLEPVVLWTPPFWMRHLAAGLTLPAFILLVAAYVPGNHLKARIGHPMVAGTKLWALAHLLSNGNLGDLLLFGSFLIWAIADFVSARRRDRAAGRTYPAGQGLRTALTVITGVVAWVVFARLLHAPLIGVAPFGLQ